jgi:two-component system KDP operon response regulator KdpE
MIATAATATTTGAAATSSEQPLVLLVDDQATVRALSAATLQASYRILEAADGKQALQLLFQHKPDLILLDLNMPVMDGWETLRRIRELTAAPVILLTAHGEDHFVVRGLDAGAQDYIVKPFSTLQLVARVRATLRDHAAAPPATEELLSFDEGRLVLDVGRRLAIVRGQEVELSATEYKILHLLAQHAPRVLSQDQILENVWGPEYRGEPGYVKTYAGMLRKKIEADPAQPLYLLSRRGLGYFLNVRR